MKAKTRVMLIGGVIGAMIGTVAGMLYYNSAVELDEKGMERVSAPRPQDALKLGVGVLAILRSLAGV